MTWIYNLMEILATVCEGAVMLCAVTHISCERYLGRKHKLFISLFSFIYTVAITALNIFSDFSFLTIGVAFVFMLLSSRFISEGTWLLRSTATVISFLVVNAVDYICLFIFCMVTESPVTDTYSFRVLLSPSPLRCLYLAVDKGVITILLVLFWHFLPKIQKIARKQTVWLLCASLAVYIAMSALIGLIMGQSLLAMQNAIMFSCIFSCLCVFAVIALLLINGDYQEEKQRAELLRTTNQLIAQNYQELYENRKEIARRIHDFNHHIKALEVLASQEQAEKTAQYTRSLLKTSYAEKNFCKSGNDIIDAVINCKAAEAEVLSVPFQYSVDLPRPIEIDPVDVCAILSNQIDNAFEASQHILDGTKRDISVKIWVKSDSTLFFRVENYVDADPLISNPNLHTTKANAHELHGLGLQNIADTAKKYGGALRSFYQDHYFVSTVFVCLNPF
jgi:hypothetical protein